MRSPRLLLALLFIAALPGLHAQGLNSPAAPPAFWGWAATPPMGWNSYDSYGDSVTEAEILLNAKFMKDRLLPHGWNYVVVDYRWYDPDAHVGPINKPTAAPLAADNFGRLLPAPNRFPSAGAGAGFKPLADQIHGLGLKFGIHMMRGIPRQSVKTNTPIEDSPYRAADAADTQNTCPWCADMYGVDASRPAGQAWYDSVARLCAQWGVDFIKVDDLSKPYSSAEIEAIRKAIDKCGRPIVFSTSPGETPLQQAGHVGRYANMWRVSDDFWDRWKDITHQMDLLAQWSDRAAPGHWPDADMIPLGHLGPRCPVEGANRQTRLTPAEQRTLMSLWALAPSPLMLGMNLPDLERDPATLELLTNDEALAINQDPAGQAATRVSAKGGLETWVRRLADGGGAVGLFNRTEQDAPITLPWAAAGLTGRQTARDVWARKPVGVFEQELTLTVPRHGSVLLRLNAPKPSAAR